MAYIENLGSGGKTAPSEPKAKEGPNHATTLDRLKEESSDTAELLTAMGPDLPLGARLYINNCNACHFDDGEGGRKCSRNLPATRP